VDVSNLLLKFRYLKSEKSRCDKIVKESKSEFFSEIRSIQCDLNVRDKELDEVTSHGFNRNVEQNVEDENDECEPDGDEDYSIRHSHPDWVKKLFKKIAFLTHPDKVPENLAEEIKDRLDTFYKRAVSSYDTDSHMDLIEIGFDLGLDVTGIDKKDISSLEDECESIEKDIKLLKESLFWIWFHSSRKEKDTILSDFIKARGWDSASSQMRKSHPGKPGQSVAWIRKKLGKS